MAAKKKSWAEKIEAASAPHVTVLEKPFAGIPAGARLAISSPKEIGAIVAKLKPGETIDVKSLRERIAKAHKADAACPMTTSIFLRILAEHALEEMAAGKPAGAVTPFWRAIDPASPLAKKLSCGVDQLTHLRKLEA
jgi:hypothetical protein